MTTSDENTNDSGILLRASDVEGWKREWETIDERIKIADAQVKELRARRGKLAQLLEGAKPFAIGLAEWLKNQEAARLEKEAREAPDDIALTDAILRLLKNKGPSSRDKIRQNLPTHGYSIAKIEANPNYLYTALGRLVEREKIEGDPTGVYRLKG